MLTLPGPVVDADWLQAHHSDPALRIVDARWSLAPPAGRERYAAGHLPGAIFLDIDHDLSSPGEGPGRHPLPAAARLERVLAGAGIGDRHLVVAYDDSGGSTAARVWWLFRHFGHADRVAVLDGGIEAWTRAGGELVTDVPQHPAATWTAGPARVADRQPTIAYCGAGVTAAQLLLAMEVAGIDSARLYEGSWSDWSSDPARPAATGSRP